MLLTSRNLNLSTFFKMHAQDRVIRACVKAFLLCEAMKADSLPLVVVLCRLIYLKPGSLHEQSNGKFNLTHHMQQLSKAIDDLLFAKCSSDDAVPVLLLVALSLIKQSDYCELSIYLILRAKPTAVQPKFRLCPPFRSPLNS